MAAAGGLGAAHGIPDVRNRRGAAPYALNGSAILVPDGKAPAARVQNAGVAKE